MQWGLRVGSGRVLIKSGPEITEPKNASEINVNSNIFMLDNLSKNQKLIMPTSNSAYGVGDKNNFCDENSELKPLSTYAKDKVFIENELLNSQNFISLRLATVFGMSPRMRLDLLVNDFVYRACRDNFVVLYESHFKRNYVHISDVTDLIIYCISNFDKMKNNVFNVGLSDANLSKLELCEKIKDYLPNFKIIIDEFEKDEDQRNYIVSNKKIEKTGFKPKYSISDGIKELIKGYKMIKNQNFGNF